MDNIVRNMVSEHIMGWQQKTVRNNENDAPYYANYWLDANGEKQRPVNFWKPDLDLTDAFRVIEVLRERDIFITIETCRNGFKSYHNGIFATESESSTLAICIASLKSIDIEISDEYSVLK